jgi:hypothetical protein
MVNVESSFYQIVSYSINEHEMCASVLSLYLTIVCPFVSFKFVDIDKCTSIDGQELTL